MSASGLHLIANKTELYENTRQRRKITHKKVTMQGLQEEISVWKNSNCLKTQYSIQHIQFTWPIKIKLKEDIYQHSIH